MTPFTISDLRDLSKTPLGSDSSSLSSSTVIGYQSLRIAIMRACRGSTCTFMIPDSAVVDRVGLRFLLLLLLLGLEHVDADDHVGRYEPHLSFVLPVAQLHHEGGVVSESRIALENPDRFHRLVPRLPALY